MGLVIKYFRVGVVITLLFLSSLAFAQPPFPGPPGGGPPPHPCPGPPWMPCPQIPISGGIEFLIIAGMIIGIKKLYDKNKNRQ